MAYKLSRLFSRKEKPAKIELRSANQELWGHPLVKQCYLQMSLGHRDIETTIEEPAVMRQLMDRVIGQWKDLAAEPYWCNDTSEWNKLAKINDNTIEAFYAAGSDWMRNLDAFESRSGVKMAKGEGVCVELGAGVGKHTHVLAKRFKSVIAVDVSSHLLSISEQRMKKVGIKNVAAMTLKSPDDLSNLDHIDFFMAQSVLQCNPPPIQRAILEHAFRALVPGGFALFQTPDWLEGYKFSSKQFIKSAPDATCDCHCLPKVTVLKILKDNGMELLDFAPDFNTECFGCYTYFARKLKITN